MLLAYTRAVSPALARCELTHLARAPIDVARALAEHAAYEAQLVQLGLEVRRLPPEPTLPDAVFVEDTAIVLDEVAVVTRPGAPSRRGETPSVESALAQHRSLLHIEAPATLDGGDVLVAAGRRVYVGLSSRTSRAAVTQLGELLGPLGYEVIPVDFRGCLHLKSAVTTLGDDLLLLNPQWVDPGAFTRHRHVAVDPAEPHAANALSLAGGVIFPRQFPHTRQRLQSEGLSVWPVDTTELAKAEAGVTCCSLLVRID
jgi:dimethylargininase